MFMSEMMTTWPTGSWRHYDVTLYLGPKFTKNLDWNTYDVQSYLSPKQSVRSWQVTKNTTGNFNIVTRLIYVSRENWPKNDVHRKPWVLRTSLICIRSSLDNYRFVPHTDVIFVVWTNFGVGAFLGDQGFQKLKCCITLQLSRVQFAARIRSKSVSMEFTCIRFCNTRMGKR